MYSNLKALKVNSKMIEATLENHKVKEVLDKMITADTQLEREELRAIGLIHLIELMKIDSEILKTITE